MGEIDPYFVLGLSRDATPDQIRAAFRTAARHHHPDTATGTSDDSAVRDLIAAYHLLSDPIARAAHDAERDRRGPRAPQNPIRAPYGEPHFVGQTPRLLRCSTCRGIGSLRTDYTCPACRGRAEITDLSRRRAVVFR